MVLVNGQAPSSPLKNLKSREKVTERERGRKKEPTGGRRRGFFVSSFVREGERQGDGQTYRRTYEERSKHHANCS